MAKADMKEDAVLTQCLTYLLIQGFFVWRNNTGALYNKAGRLIRFGYAGSADILGILHNGRFLAVECKRENGGVLSDKQRIFGERITRDGGLYLVVHSVGDLQRQLKEHKVSYF